MSTTDNKFPSIVTGASGWDGDLGNLITILERGYHVTERAGVAINTGQVLWLSNSGFFFPFDPNSASITPMALAFSAANSGDTITALTRGIVRSLGINSAATIGQPAYVSTSTPGLIVSSYDGADRPIGFGLDGYGILFDVGIYSRPRLRTLADVSSSGLTDGYKPRWVNSNASVQSLFQFVPDTLGALTDVNTNGIFDGAVIQWANATSKWGVTSMSGGGGGGGAAVGSWQNMTFTNTMATFSCSINTMLWLSTNIFSLASGQRIEVIAEVSGVQSQNCGLWMLTADGAHGYAMVSQGDGNKAIYQVKSGGSVTLYGSAQGGAAAQQWTGLRRVQCEFNVVGNPDNRFYAKFESWQWNGNVPGADTTAGYGMVGGCQVALMTTSVALCNVQYRIMG
jgi:hypothetical protein